MPKILVIDIETKPAQAYVWGTYKVNISPEQVSDPGGMLCFAAKWVGEKDVMFYSVWTHSKTEMLSAAHALLSEADAVIGYNSDRFDLQKLNGEFLLEGFAPVGRVTSIDLLKTVKKFGFLMNRLAFIGPLLRIGHKIKHEGFELWAGVMNGNALAQIKMEKYNRHDVVLTEKLYQKIKPYIHNHPHLGEDKRECGACGSNRVWVSKWRRTKSYRIQQLHCQDCGSYQDGKKEMIK